MPGSPLVRVVTVVAAAAGLLGLLIADIFDSSLAPRAEQVFLWLAIGMMYGQRAK